MHAEAHKSRAVSSARVLLLPPTIRDAQALEAVLAQAGIACELCSTISACCQSLGDSISAAVISEEALLADPDELTRWVLTQPVWSDLPIVVLSRSGVESPALGFLLQRLGNVSILERPVRVTTLLYVLQSCVRARERQFQARDHFLEREQLLASERYARSEAERAIQLKDEFLATLSHELRTPLNAIMGWASLLAFPGTTADHLQGAKVIERNARAQAQLIEDLLDMSRITSGKLRLEVREIDLADVVQNAMLTVMPAVEAKGIELSAALEPRPAGTTGDPNRLQQVFWNLLSNAVKFTPKEGRVHVGLRQLDSQWEVSVEDSGEGIESDFLPFVFDRFRQGNATTTRKHGGLGLGLAIVKQLVELHGGTIRATSAGVGLGATFIVSLPSGALKSARRSSASRTHARDSRARAAEVDGDRAEARQLSGLKVLVVDDEPDARELLRRILEEYGACVLAAASAERALALIESESPDLLVSDIGMAGEDGYSLIRRARELAPNSGRTLPAVALTAYSREEDRLKALRAGFQHHLAKPLKPSELIAMLASMAGR